jgi:hypothetical protein
MAREVHEAAVERRLPKMSAMTIFYQECPTCGRNLRVPVKYFGRPMSCTHCEGEFIAGKAELPRAAPPPLAEGTDGQIATQTFSQPQLGEV